ncbi:MAG: glycosyltransferase family 9 protein [Flavobacteriales bacterium]|jgi:heptosyltransferase-2|nr:glycosyltransferase family 9 protein [Flavobacteriales bacterium]
MAQQQFLIIQTAFLGDAVLATSILEKLHAFYPDAAIDLVVRKGNDGLFTGHPFLRTLHVWDKRQGKTRALFKLIGTLRKQRFDHVINAQRFFSTGLMTALSGGKETIGYDKNPLSFLFSRKVKHRVPEPKVLREQPVKSDAVTIHEVDRLNDLIAHLTDGSRPLPKLYPTAEDRSDVDQTIPSKTPAGSLAEDPAGAMIPQGPEAETLREEWGQYITIAPASVWFTKQWPAEKWIALIKALPADRRILLIGAPGDIPLCERIAKEAGRGEVLAGKLSLLGTAALMEGAAMNYVNDSAPMHIASAMNAPVTAVFCSTIPAFGFGPLNANGRIVDRAESLYCRPCGLHGYKACPEGHFKCAWEIADHQVIG